MYKTVALVLCYIYTASTYSWCLTDLMPTGFKFVMLPWSWHIIPIISSVCDCVWTYSIIYREIW